RMINVSQFVTRRYCPKAATLRASRASVQGQDQSSRDALSRRADREHRLAQPADPVGPVGVTQEGIVGEHQLETPLRPARGAHVQVDVGGDMAVLTTGAYGHRIAAGTNGVDLEPTGGGPRHEAVDARRRGPPGPRARVG